MRRKLSQSILYLVFAITLNAWADPQSEARTLKDESLKILKENTDRDAPPSDMAKCIFNLEKAAGILELANDTDSDLAKEVNSQLYWARKRSTLAIDAALDKLRGASGVARPVQPKPAASKPSTPATPGTPGGLAESGMTVEDEIAKKAFAEVQKFAQAHTVDDYVLSLRWFEFAGKHPGTDYSLKALTLGREAQARFKATNPNAQKEVLPDTPEMQMLHEADALVLEKMFDKAVPLYTASLKMKETIITHRKLGQAYFGKAQVVWEELMLRRPELASKLNTAIAGAYTTVQIRGVSRRVRNPNDPALIEAQRNCSAFDKECEAVFAAYDKARDEFKAVLRMATGGKDLIASAFIGLCLSRKNATMSSAKSHMAQFLKDYTPANDDERGVYDYCKTELERLNQKK